MSRIALVNRMRYILITLSCLFSLSAMAQVNEAWYDDLQAWIMAEEDGDENQSIFEDYCEILASLATEKVRINEATPDEMGQIPFITAQQIDDIAYYISVHGPLRSPQELILIRSIDATTAHLLRHFVSFEATERVEQKTFSQLLRNANHEAVVYANVPFYTTQGDINAYLGPRYKHWLRYTLTAGKKMKAGFVASQDAGEPFFAAGNKYGYDYYSFFVNIKDLGRIENLVAGNYQVRMGMGLVMNNSFSYGKLTTQPNIGNTRNELRSHVSRSAGNYLQGAAATIRLSNKLHLTSFASSRLIDGTPLNDGSGISSIVKNGYHRTTSEMKRKNNLRQTTAGGSLRLGDSKKNIGFNGMFTALSQTLKPNKTALYRKYYPEGDHFWNASVDYNLSSRRWSLAGETATGGSGGIATLNTLTFIPVSHFQTMFTARHYSYRYSSLFANAYGNNSDVRNETGATLTTKWIPSTSLSLQFFTDYAYSPKPRYGITAASQEWDNMLMATYMARKYTVNARYRLRMRQRDNDAKTFLQNYTEQRWRLQVSSSQYAAWQWRLQTDAALSTRKGNSFGWMLSGYVSHQFGSSSAQNSPARCFPWLRLRTSAALFHTDDYYSRLYASDGAMRYTMTLPMVYGHGCRGSVLASISVIKELILQTRFSLTKYFNRQTIGSSYQQINSSVKSDLEIQLLWRL